jgi:molybdenum cofactor biosynthesis enzyme MoaA
MPDALTIETLTARLAARGLTPRVDRSESFLQVLRLIVSSRCKRGCHYPDGSEVWCHAEGITRRNHEPYGLDDFVGAAATLGRTLGVRRVKIAGLEPTFDASFVPFIAGLRAAGFERVSITTHDDAILPHLAAYRDAGLTQISVSIPSHEDARFREVAYTGSATPLLDLVKTAKGLGLDPVKINRVLQRGFTDDLPVVIDWARRHDVTVKLFELMWTPEAAGSLDRFYVAWLTFLDLWLDATEDVTLAHYPLSFRTRARFRLRGGGAVEANLMEDKRGATAAACATCAHTTRCAEGYFGCGVRVLPDLSVLPCLLRPELAVSLPELFQNGERTAALAQVLRGSHTPRVAGTPTPLIQISPGGRR